jgi:hypothetical protein
VPEPEHARAAEKLGQYFRKLLEGGAATAMEPMGAKLFPLGHWKFVKRVYFPGTKIVDT